MNGKIATVSRITLRQQENVKVESSQPEPDTRNNELLNYRLRQFLLLFYGGWLEIRSSATDCSSKILFSEWPRKYCLAALR